ncbi:MAG: TolC family protein [Proteobacteria bacterium]|nr:TolC family protein [Pseudomonadota bacterium]
MFFGSKAAYALAAMVASLSIGPAVGKPPRTPAARASTALSLGAAVQRALDANPRLTAAEREIGAAQGKQIQAGALPNPELSLDVDNIAGSGPYRGGKSAETTLQISQLIELGGKRDARIAAGAAGYDAARWERAALRLEIASETAVAFVNVLSAQRRVQIFEAQIDSLNRITPLLQRRTEAGAAPPSEALRAQIAADIAKADMERARATLAASRRELAAQMGLTRPDFTGVRGDIFRVGHPPALEGVLQAVDRNPQLMRWTAVYAQRHAEYLSARLKAIPDLQAGVGWRHFRESGDNSVRLSLSMPLPVLNQNQGGIRDAQEMLAKTEAERAANKIALSLVLGRAHDTLSGALREISVLRSSTIPKARQAVESVEAGYGQGRFTLLEVLDMHAAAVQAALRELEALVNFHTALATLEGLSGHPVSLRGFSK